MKVWNYGKWTNVEIGQKVFIGRCGSGTTVFGEFGVLERTTQRHLVFKADSGAIIKTDIDNLCRVIGKAGQQNYFVSVNVDRKDFIHSRVFIY